MGAPGCDDAPVVDIAMVGANRRFTLVVPYYENPRFFAKQIGTWLSYPDDLRSRMKIIVVDDGSPNYPAERVLAGKRDDGRIRLFRIDIDVRWNWLAARNIGAYHADEGWIMLTDMDHVLEENTLNTLVNGAFDVDKIYRFSRREFSGKKIHPHPNSWFMTRNMYWRVGGYDEALSGHYGTDGEYRRRCASTAQIRIMRDELVRYEYVDDSSTTHYKRKQPEDAAAKKMIRARTSRWKPTVLTFPYHAVDEWSSTRQTRTE